MRSPERITAKRASVIREQDDYRTGCNAAGVAGALRPLFTGLVAKLNETISFGNQRLQRGRDEMQFIVDGIEP